MTGPTKKQQQVLDRLAAGEHPQAIAKAMKITSSGVYGHMRNMRLAGIELPGERLSNGRATEVLPAEVEVMAAISPDEDDLTTRVREAIAKTEADLTRLRGALAVLTQ